MKTADECGELDFGQVLQLVDEESDRPLGLASGVADSDQQVLQVRFEVAGRIYRTV